MRRFAGSSTNALLQKASAQLSGSKVASTVSTAASVDDDGLADYLQSLNKKPTKPALQWDKFGELSDLSADETNSDKNLQKTMTTTAKTSSNKFIKKKPESQPLLMSQKPVQIPSKVSSACDTAIQSTMGKVHARSSALGKVQSFAAKYDALRGGTASKVTTLPSDSDLELSLSPDEEVLADTRAVKHRPEARHDAVDSGSNMTQSKSSVLQSVSKLTGTVKPSSLHSDESKTPATALVQSTQTKSKPTSFHSTTFHALSDDDDSKSSSVGIGKGGSKFMKKGVSSVAESSYVMESKLSSVEKPIKKSAEAKSSTATEPAAAVAVSDNRLGRMGMAVLDSDDESLAEFMGQVSSQKQQHGPSAALQKQLTSSSHSLLVTTDDDALTSSHVEDTVSEAESDHFRLNVHAIDALDYDVDKDLANATTGDDVKTVPLARHTTAVDKLDICGHGVDSSLRLQYESDFESVHSSSRGVSSPAAPLRSILSGTPRSLTPKSSRSRVRLMEGLAEVRSRSPSPVFTARSRSRSPSPVLTGRSNSLASLPDEQILTGRSAASSVRTAVSESESARSNNSEQSTCASSSEVTARAITNSETDHLPHRRMSRRRSSEPSLLRMSATATMSYSEDFISSRTSVDYSEQTSSVSDSVEHRRRHRKHRCKSKAIQTGLDVGLHYSWPRGSTDAVATAQYGLAFVDPASVAATVVSADTLEAMTSYSPSAVALNNMFHQQLQLTRQFVAIQNRLHHDLVMSLQSVAESYRYTTLGDTKEFIRKNRPPVMTFDDALRDVKQEMRLV